MNAADEQEQERQQEQQLCEAIVKDIGQLFKTVVPPGYGFIFSVFTFAPGMLSYCSNADREDCVRTLRALADRLETGSQEPLP